MASVSQVRSVVDSVIGTHLGTYNLPDGSTSPALWVRGSQQVPKDWSCLLYTSDAAESSRV